MCDEVEQENNGKQFGTCDFVDHHLHPISINLLLFMYKKINH